MEEIPREVERALRKKAAPKRQRLNQVVVDELTHAIVGTKAITDFSELVGKWTPNLRFDQIIAAQREIDSDQWK